MEKIDRYRDIVDGLLQEYYAFLTDLTRTDVDTEILIDDLHGQYLLMRIGWRGESRVRRPLFYLRLKDNKIYIEEDWTKEGIANELIRAGVEQSDIVLAFNAPSVRSELPAFALS